MDGLSRSGGRDYLDQGAYVRLRYKSMEGLLAPHARGLATPPRLCNRTSRDLLPARPVTLPASPSAVLKASELAAWPFQLRWLRPRRSVPGTMDELPASPPSGGSRRAEPALAHRRPRRQFGTTTTTIVCPNAARKRSGHPDRVWRDTDRVRITARGADRRYSKAHRCPYPENIACLAADRRVEIL